MASVTRAALSFALPLLAIAPHGAAAQEPVPAADPAAAVRFYETYERARGLYEAGRYAEAEPLLEELTRALPADGSLWHHLGRARQRRGDAPGAIEAYRTSLERGYRHAAWVFYQVARLHAEMGRRDSALAWLERSLDRRWDDRPGIADDTAFHGLADDPRFDRIAGRPRGAPPGRDQMWRRDIDHLVAEAKRMHAGPDRPAHSEAFQSAAADLKARVPNLSDDRMVLELGRLLAMLGDGHTGIYGGAGPDSPLDLRAASLPLLFYEFTDGVFVVDAAEGRERWIGAQVVAFGDVPTQEALDALSTYVHHDNAMTVKWLGVRFVLPSLRFLQAIGATDDFTRATLTLLAADGREHRIGFEGGDHVRRFRRKLRPPPAADSVPLYLSRVEAEYWVRPLPGHDALYFQFNQVRDTEDGPSIAQFADTLRAALERTDARHLILDVRHNNGGNNNLVWPFLRTLTWWEQDEPDHTLYVITGRNTFSAAQNFIARLERMTDGIFVGEPSSSSPNFTGEETNLVLPYTRVRGSISNRYWQESDPGDERPFIAPRVPVGLSSELYFSGRDPALEAILEIIAGGG